ncbi:MAG: AAA family ATPase [Thermoplasmata archaeon]
MSDNEARRDAGRTGTGGARQGPVRSAARRTTRRRGWVALTGTPGTGKSKTARRLSSRLHAVEVKDLALQLGAGRRRGPGSVEVDLTTLRRAFRSFARSSPDGVVVGHLAHFLPVSYIVVLRCNPVELARRLRGARRTPGDRTANVLSEALDIVLVEALAAGVPVREVDTTDRSVAEVARIVEGLVRRRPAARYGQVSWLADHRVTEELLRGAL